MGIYWSSGDTTLDSSSIKSKKIILINQACCYQCNSTVTSNGTCKCGNVEVYGGNEELGRRIKNDKLYSDCSLIEYKVK